MNVIKTSLQSDMALVRVVEGIPEQMVQLATIASQGLTQVMISWIVEWMISGQSDTGDDIVDS